MSSVWFSPFEPARTAVFLREPSLHRIVCGLRIVGVVELSRTHSKLPLRPASPFITMVHVTTSAKASKTKCLNIPLWGFNVLPTKLWVHHWSKLHTECFPHTANSILIQFDYQSDDITHYIRSQSCLTNVVGACMHGTTGNMDVSTWSNSMTI